MDKPGRLISGWRYNRNAAETNDIGFRGRNISYSPGDYVVVLLGDSFVECNACPFDAMPEVKLERYLVQKTGRSVKVVSVAASGYGQDQQLIALRDYFKKHRADMVVLWETPSNDLYDNMFPFHAEGAFKPTYILKDDRLSGPLFPPGGIDEPPLKIAAAARRAYLKFIVKDFNPGWAAKNLPPAYEPIKNYKGHASSCLENAYSSGALPGLEMLYYERSTHAIALAPPSPRMKYAVRLANSLLKEIAREAHGHGAAFFAFAHDIEIPCLKNGMYKFDGSYYRLSAKQYRENVGRMNSGVDFRFVPVRERNWAVSSKDLHLNSGAVDMLMDDVAGVISRQKLVR